MNQYPVAMLPLFPFTLDLIDVAGAQTKSMSHKVFGNISRTGQTKCGKHYFVGIGGFAEFGKNSNAACAIVDPSLIDTTDTINTGISCNNNSCLRVTPSQWGLWFKVGVSCN